MSAAARATSAFLTRRFRLSAPPKRREKKMSEATTATMNFARRDARDKLRGRTRFTIDRARPGMLYAALARARIPSARIVRIDASAARGMPGVRAIITGADAPFRYGI